MCRFLLENDIKKSSWNRKKIETVSYLKRFLSVNICITF